MISNVNLGVCQWRATNGKPSVFVNYQEDGQNKYEFFTLMYRAYQRFYFLQGLELI